MLSGSGSLGEEEGGSQTGQGFGAAAPLSCSPEPASAAQSFGGSPQRPGLAVATQPLSAEGQAEAHLHPWALSLSSVGLHVRDAAAPGVQG